MLGQVLAYSCVYSGMFAVMHLDMSPTHWACWSTMCADIKCVSTPVAAYRSNYPPAYHITYITFKFQS